MLIPHRTLRSRGLKITPEFIKRERQSEAVVHVGNFILTHVLEAVWKAAMYRAHDSADVVVCVEHDVLLTAHLADELMPIVTNKNLRRAQATPSLDEGRKLKSKPFTTVEVPEVSN